MRIRTIKPEFWTDEKLALLTEPGLLLAIGLLNYADDEGFFNAHPALIKAAIFPLRETSVPVTGMLRELSSVGYIAVENIEDGRSIGVVVKFKTHQVVNKPKPSILKRLTKLRSMDGTPTVSIPDQSGQEGKGEGTGNREQGEGDDALSSALVLDGPGAEKGELKTKLRDQLMAILTLNGVTMRLGKDNLFEEWCGVVTGWHLDYIAIELRTARPKIMLPSELKKHLKTRRDDFEAWLKEHRAAQMAVAP